MLSELARAQMAGEPPPIDRGDENKPRILLLGKRRSGKSSIASVVFHKMDPRNTLFLPSTQNITKENMHSFMDFQVWDFPGQLNFMDPAFDSSTIFPVKGSVIWVIDAQDDMEPALIRLYYTILHCHQFYPSINIEIFIHKVDTLSSDGKNDIKRDIKHRLEDELSDNGFDDVKLHWHLTSIYDNSIFEAFSTVLHKLVPELDSITEMLDLLQQSSAMSEVYIIDVLSKIFVASNTRNDDGRGYELASEYVDMVLDCTSVLSETLEPSNSSSPILSRTQSRLSNGRGHGIEDLDNDPSNSSLTSQVSLDSGDVRTVYIQEMNRFLVLVCFCRSEATARWDEFEQNVKRFKQALQALFDITIN